MNRILFVSIAFPPCHDPESAQVARHLKYLTRHFPGRIDVVTATNPTSKMSHEQSLDKSSCALGQLIRLPTYHSLLTDRLARKVIPDHWIRPDRKFGFHMQARRVVRRLAFPPALIYSRSNPLSSAIMGRKLAAQYGVPWIMHLSDPWSDNPLQTYSTRARGVQSTLERTCFEEASAVCLTSQQTVDFYSTKYPSLARKFHLSPNVYDPDEIIAPTNSQSTKLRIAHTGALYGGRSCKPLLCALDLLGGHEDVNAVIDVTFAGGLEESEEQLIASYKATTIRSLGQVSYDQARTIQSQSDVLIAIDAPAATTAEAMFFPSKLLDYMTAGKPIIAITPPGSATRAILAGHLARCFAHDETQELADHLQHLLVANRGGDRAAFAAPPPSEAFSAVHCCKVLADLFATFGVHPSTPCN